MHLSRIRIESFRNFSMLDVAIAGNVVVVGENKVGKSNLMYALRLLFDPSLPDSVRELGLAISGMGSVRQAPTTRSLSASKSGTSTKISTCWRC